jgi:hypothetical protein
MWTNGSRFKLWQINRQWTSLFVSLVEFLCYFRDWNIVLNQPLIEIPEIEFRPIKSTVLYWSQDTTSNR